MPEPLQNEDIASEYRDKVTTQSYSEKETIEGVLFIDLPHFSDDGGSFVEVARLTAGIHDWIHNIPVAQVSYAEMLPGTVKAFHLHLNQEDVWFVPPSSRMLVGLHDARETSPTKGRTMRLILGEGKAKLLLLPRGVAHGIKNIDTKPGLVFYFVSQQFSKENPDEKRLPWDMLGTEFWEASKG